MFGKAERYDLSDIRVKKLQLKGSKLNLKYLSLPTPLLEEKGLLLLMFFSEVNVSTERRRLGSALQTFCVFSSLPLRLRQRGLARLHHLHVGWRLHPQQLHQEGPDGGAEVELGPRPLQLQLHGAPAALLHPHRQCRLSPVPPADLTLVSLL